MSFIIQYFEWFAGFGLLALLVFHPTYATDVISGVQALAVKVTNLGVQNASH